MKYIKQGLLVVIFAVPFVSSALTSQTFSYYDQYDSTDCTKPGHENFYNFCEAWNTRMNSKVGWNEEANYDGGYIREAAFCDYDEETWCHDTWTAGVETADATMVCVHGWHEDGWFKFRNYFNGPGEEGCQSYARDWELGDGDLEWLVYHSCLSMDKDQGLWATTSWGAAMDGLRQVNGFHGGVCLECADLDMEENYEEFVDDAFNYPIGTAWIDNLNLIKDGDDHCAVARAEGDDLIDAFSRLVNDEYDDYHEDDPTGDFWAIQYVSGCDPNHSNEL